MDKHTTDITLKSAIQWNGQSVTAAGARRHQMICKQWLFPSLGPLHWMGHFKVMFWSSLTIERMISRLRFVSDDCWLFRFKVVVYTLYNHWIAGFKVMVHFVHFVQSIWMAGLGCGFLVSVSASVFVSVPASVSAPECVSSHMSMKWMRMCMCMARRKIHDGRVGRGNKSVTGGLGRGGGNRSATGGVGRGGRNNTWGTPPIGGEGVRSTLLFLLKTLLQEPKRREKPRNNEKTRNTKRKVK